MDDLWRVRLRFMLRVRQGAAAEWQAGSPAMWPSKRWQYVRHAFAHAETDALEHGQKDVLDDTIIELENHASKRMKGITMASGSNAQRRQLQANNFKLTMVCARSCARTPHSSVHDGHVQRSMQACSDNLWVALVPCVLRTSRESFAYERVHTDSMVKLKLVTYLVNVSDSVCPAVKRCYQTS